VHLDHELADRAELGLPEHRDGVLGAAERLARRRQVREPVVPLDLQEAPLVVVEQDEPPHRHVPRAVHDRRDLPRLAPPEPAELPHRATGARVRDEHRRVVEHGRLAERQHAGEDRSVVRHGHTWYRPSTTLT
jgi:hypothetical protein